MHCRCGGTTMKFIIALVLLGSTCLALTRCSDVPLNQLMVKFGVDPFHKSSFFIMPRTEAEALRDKYTMAQDFHSTKGYSTWCREKDYRVCVLLDRKGSVAGLQVSHAVSEMKATGVPQQWDSIPDWNRQTLLGTEVYSAITYFVDPVVLRSGNGRAMNKNTNTAEGMWIEQKGFVQKVPFTEKELERTSKYTRQGCFIAMGRHYFYDLSKTSKCEDRRPYYLLYGEKSQELHGYGVITFGKIPKGPGRDWFINPPSLISNIVAPNGPSCTKDWMCKYGATSLHVYFRAHPWLIFC